jgi:hypothetical protein
MKSKHFVLNKVVVFEYGFVTVSQPKRTMNLQMKESIKLLGWHQYKTWKGGQAKLDYL